MAKLKTNKKQGETISFNKLLEAEFGKVGTKKRAVNDAKLNKIQKEMVKKEYKEAYERLYTLAFNKETFTTDETNEIERLKNLIDVYQNEHIKLPNPKPLEAIKFRMEQMNLKLK